MSASYNQQDNTPARQSITQPSSQISELIGGSDPKKYGSLRMLTPQKLKNTYRNRFRKIGIDVDDIPTNIWIDLRRSLVFEGDLEPRVIQILRQLFKAPITNEQVHSTILLWLLADE
jgi:hypothetical protein